MKSFWFCILSLSFSFSCLGQNLIRNPYFDIDSSQFGSSIAVPNIGWEISNASHYFNYTYCLPISPLGCIGKKGIPYPKFGIGFYSIIGEFNSVGNHRIFIASYLSDTLKAGEEYLIEFYYRPWQRNNYNVDRLEVVLSTDTFIDLNNYMNYHPADAGINTPITDTTQWLLFSETIVATGGEYTLTIGNFSPQNQTTLIPNPPNTNAPLSFNVGRWPLIFIDGVFVYKATDTLYTITLPQDTLLCPGETLDLIAVLDSGFKLQDTVTTYLWNTGSTDSNITVSQPGTYWVQSTINKRFVQTDTIVVTYFDTNYTLDLPDSIGFCENENANLLANTIPQTHYYWSNGDTTRGISIGYSTTLELTAVTPCYTLQESVTVYQKQCENYIYIPNAFTPDGNGTNDYFEFYGVPEPVSLLVFDRWGGIVYQNPDYRNDWDGTSLSGDTLPTGVYSYVIEYQYINPNASQTDPEGSTRQIRGTVNLVR